jgi:hypothetical protein
MLPGEQLSRDEAGKRDDVSAHARSFQRPHVRGAPMASLR